MRETFSFKWFLVKYTGLCNAGKFKTIFSTNFLANKTQRKIYFKHFPFLSFPLTHFPRKIFSCLIYKATEQRQSKGLLKRRVNNKSVESINGRT